jgi:sporulation protein YlmC with PRC-barrel domain
VTGALRKSFFGYHTRQVDEGISRLRAEQQARVGELLAVLGRLKAENEQLTHQKAGLMELSNRTSKKLPTLDFARGQVARSAAIIVANARHKGKQIQEEAKTKAGSQRSYLSVIASEIDALQKEFLVSLTSIQELLASKQASLSGGDETTISTKKVAGTILPSKKRESLFVSNMGGGILKVNIAQQGKDILTRSGTSIGTVSHLVLDRNKGVLVGYALGTTNLQGVPKESIVPAGEVLALKNDSLIVRDECLHSLIKPAALIDKYESFNELSQQTALKAPGRPPLTAPGFFPATDLAAPAADAETADPGLNQAIKKHRLGYVVGKIVGQRLTDAAGELIVDKGDVITPEVVARADAAGKLAELIVHMRIPGLDIDEAL